MSLGELWPQTGLIGLYHLESNANDSSGSGINGSATGITYSQTYGKFNKGAYSNATAGNIINFGNNFNVTTGDMTWSMLIKLDTSADGSMFLSKGLYNGYGYYFQLSLNKVTFLSSQSGANQRVSSAVTLSNGVWYHLVCIKSGTTITIYINGHGDSGTIINPASNTANFTLFDYSTGGFPCKTSLDEVAIFNVAKSANWVRQQYALMTGKLD